MTWACEAYGDEGERFGALCFFADTAERSCETLAVCHARLTEERQRVFRRINELAAAGDDSGEYLSDAFPNPDPLLGGSRTDEEG